MERAMGIEPTRTAPHSWKDFFIHIAAIACGLLLALALDCQ
jgi:hypothetical protein